MCYSTDHRYIDMLHGVQLSEWGVLMCLHFKHPNECFRTHITGIWTLASMCQLVPLEMRLMNKYLFTHITAI
jgi:hypothetical protein